MGIVLRKKKDFAKDGVPLDVPIYAVSSRRFSVQRDGWNGIVVYKDKESRDMIDMLLARVKKLEDVVYGKDNKNDT